MKWTTEAKVGLFTVIGIVLFAMCIIFLGRIELFQPPQMHITGEFKSVNGLKPGNQVKYSGVSIGRIKDMTVTDTGVTVAMEIKEDTKIPEDSQFSLANDGILGDKYIQVTPGKSQTYLKDGATVTGEGDSAIDKTMQQASELMKEANKTLASINAVIGDKQTQTSLRNMLRTTEVIANNTAALTGQMNAMLSDNRGNVNEMAANMVKITNDMASITNQFDSSMKQFNSDGQTGNDMRAILTNLKQTTESIQHMAGSMEGVVTDPQSAADIKATLHNTAQLSTKLNRLTGGDVVDTATGESKSGGSSSGKKFGLQAQTGLEMLYNNQTDRYSPNFEFRLRAGQSAVSLGGTHIGDGGNLELTYGKFLTDKWLLRGGLFDGDVGIGVDYGYGSPFMISLAAMDPNDQRYRIRGEFELFDDTYAVAQFVRPYSAENGGNYFGIKRVF